MAYNNNPMRKSQQALPPLSNGKIAVNHLANTLQPTSKSPIRQQKNLAVKSSATKLPNNSGARSKDSEIENNRHMLYQSFDDDEVGNTKDYQHANSSTEQLVQHQVSNQTEKHLKDLLQNQLSLPQNVSSGSLSRLSSGPKSSTLNSHQIKQV